MSYGTLGDAWSWIDKSFGRGHRTLSRKRLSCASNSAGLSWGTMDNFENNLIQKVIDYMKDTDMAVVISQSQNEIKHFEEKGLDIRIHRKRIISEELDVKFKEPSDPLRIVFVCAMWMTGFDAPPVSTMYIDKPIRNHTLMQTISRANRVFEDKQSGVIVDYYGILRNLNQALTIYGSKTGGGIGEGDQPLRLIDELVEVLEKNLELITKYFREKDIDPERILQATDLDQLRLIEQAVEAILENDVSKIMFFSLVMQPPKLKVLALEVWSQE